MNYMGTGIHLREVKAQKETDCSRETGNQSLRKKSTLFESFKTLSLINKKEKTMLQV